MAPSLANPAPASALASDMAPFVANSALASAPASDMAPSLANPAPASAPPQTALAATDPAIATASRVSESFTALVLSSAASASAAFAQPQTALPLPAPEPAAAPTVGPKARTPPTPATPASAAGPHMMPSAVVAAPVALPPAPGPPTANGLSTACTGADATASANGAASAATCMQRDPVQTLALTSSATPAAPTAATPASPAVAEAAYALPAQACSETNPAALPVTPTPSSSTAAPGTASSAAAVSPASISLTNQMPDSYQYNHEVDLIYQYDEAYQDVGLPRVTEQDIQLLLVTAIRPALIESQDWQEFGELTLDLLVKWFAASVDCCLRQMGASSGAGADRMPNLQPYVRIIGKVRLCILLSLLVMHVLMLTYTITTGVAYQTIDLYSRHYSLSEVLALGSQTTIGVGGQSPNCTACCFNDFLPYIGVAECPLALTACVFLQRL